MLDGQRDIAAFAEIAVAAEVEVGIAPGMELGGTSQGLAGADVAGTLLGVVDDDDGDGVAALQLAQIGEQRRQDVQIPAALQDAMSMQAQAERERQARVILGDSERQVAEKFAEAAKTYADNPTAFHLRAMNMLYEGLKRSNATIVIVPSTAVEFDATRRADDGHGGERHCARAGGGRGGGA